MAEYDSEYFLVFRNPKTDDNYIRATKDTAKRRVGFVEIPFEENALTYQSNIPLVDELIKSNTILFSADSFVVNDSLRTLLDDGLFGAKFFPTKVMNSGGQTSDGLWTFNNFGSLDCWCREKSTFKHPGGSRSAAGIAVLPTVKKFRLSREVLDNIAESDRLMFKMANTDTTPLFVHKRVIDKLVKVGAKGYKAIPVNRYRFGMEFV